MPRCRVAAHTQIHLEYVSRFEGPRELWTSTQRYKVDLQAYLDANRCQPGAPANAISKADEGSSYKLQGYSQHERSNKLGSLASRALLVFAMACLDSICTSTNKGSHTKCWITCAILKTSAYA